MDITENSLTLSDAKSFALRSIKWTTLAEILSRSLQPISILILTAILSPKDFGIIGIATIAINFAQIFQDMGLQKTLIQRKTMVLESSYIVFWSNLSVGIALYLIIFLSAPLVANFFNEPGVIDILRVLCVQIMLLSLITVHTALLQRGFRYKEIFLINLISSLIPFIITIPLAFSGWGVWSLVAGSLGAAVLQVIMYWHFSGWRPRLSFNIALTRELYGFGIWVVLEMALLWLIMQGDAVILGHFLGVDELGVYKVGLTVVTFIFGMVLNPFNSIIYPFFSRLRSDEDVRSLIIKISKLFAYILFPVGIGLALSARPFFLLVFGDRWVGIEIVIAIISIKEVFASLTGFYNEIYRAAGRPSIVVKQYALSVIIFIPLYILAAPYGLMVFCLARAVVGIISVMIYLFVVNRVFNLQLAHLLNCIKIPLLASIAMGIITYLLFNQIRLINRWETWGIFILIILASSAIYLFFIWLLDKKFVMDTFDLMRRAISA